MSRGWLAALVWIAACFRNEDLDRDGFVASNALPEECNEPDAWDDIRCKADCNDLDPSRSPGLIERCGNEVDEDCSGELDDLLSWPDNDRDGYSNLENPEKCSDAPYLMPGNPGDCNDGDSAISPAAAEVPGNLIDEDCDGLLLCVADGDGDHFVAPVADDPTQSEAGCASVPVGLFLGGDCDDTNPHVNPNSSELPGNSIDEDCDGSLTCYVDRDGDGYGISTLSVAVGPEVTCTGPGVAELPGDCDDDDANERPGVTWFPDLDGDGYGDKTRGSPCGRPYSFPDAITEGGDCDDTDPCVHPEACELCNGVDDDCDALPGDEGDFDQNGQPDCAQEVPLAPLHCQHEPPPDCLLP